MAMDSNCDFEQSHPLFSGETKDAATSLMEELEEFLEETEDHFHINVDSTSAEDKFIQEHFQNQSARLYSETEDSFQKQKLPRQRKPSDTFTRPEPVQTQCPINSQGSTERAWRQMQYHNNLTSNKNHVTSSNSKLSSGVNLNMLLFQTVQQTPEYYSRFTKNSSSCSNETKNFLRH